MKFYLADNQDITRAGLMFIISGAGGDTTRRTDDKAELIEALKADGNATVALDYNLFDFNGIDEMLILADRFPQSQWLLFSEDLSAEFLRQVLSSCQRISVVMKDAPMAEIREALNYLRHRRRFISQHAAGIMLAPQPAQQQETVRLTKTETEILADIARGMTSKEIAAKRFSSFHTINTHRKNIFRKLGVNSLQEATRYALRAGLVDTAEYYI